MGRSWPTKNTNPKAQNPTAQKVGTGPTASQCSTGHWWTASKPAAPSVRRVFRRCEHVDFAESLSSTHGAFSRRSRSSSFPHACGTRRIGGHHRQVQDRHAITPPRKRRTTASALRAPSCTEDNHCDRYISRQANICGDRQDPLRSRLSR